MTLNLTPKVQDFSIFPLICPNSTKKPKKISSISPRYVVELRQCSPISVLFRRKNTFLWKLTVPSPFADSGNPRKKRPAKSQTFYFVVQSIRFATQQAAGYLVSASALLNKCHWRLATLAALPDKAGQALAKRSCRHGTWLIARGNKKAEEKRLMTCSFFFL